LDALVLASPLRSLAGQRHVPEIVAPGPPGSTQNRLFVVAA